MSEQNRKQEAMAQAIGRFLKSSGMSQAALAAKVGCDPGLISRYANGATYPTAHLKSLLEVLDSTEEDLMAIYLAGLGEVDHTARLSELRTFYGFGNGAPRERINLVASTALLDSSYKNHSARNYVEIDNYADRDAIFQIGVDMGRCFPQCEIKLWSAREFSDQSFGENIILIGGPSFGSYTNNTVTDTFIKERRIPIEFDDVAIILGGKRYRFELNVDGSVKQDYCVIIRFRNMFRNERSVVAIMGHFTWGVSAASNALSIMAPPNRFAASEFSNHSDAILIFPMDRVFGKGVPDLSKSELIPF